MDKYAIFNELGYSGEQFASLLDACAADGDWLDPQVAVSAVQGYSGASPAAIIAPISNGDEKSKLRYIIVQQGGATLLLQEQIEITPREMIGISKFLGMIPSYLVAVSMMGPGGYNFTINWSKLIKQLSIEKHFVAGLNVAQYDNDDEVLNVFLFDPT